MDAEFHRGDIAADSALADGGWGPVQGQGRILVGRIPQMQAVGRHQVHFVIVNHRLHTATASSQLDIVSDDELKILNESLHIK